MKPKTILEKKKNLVTFHLHIARLKLAYTLRAHFYEIYNFSIAAEAFPVRDTDSEIL